MSDTTIDTMHRFVDAINASNKRTEKIATLKLWHDTSLGRIVDAVLYSVYNPMTTYGVTSKAVEANGNVIDCEVSLTDLLQGLETRRYSGKYALDLCKTILYKNITHKEVLMRIFDKDLKIGIDTDTINEAIGLQIPVFKVALAHDIKKSPSYSARVKSEPYFIMRKLDGVRLITVVNGAYDIRFYSRTGHEFTSLSLLRKALSQMFNADDKLVLDGELCVINGELEDFKSAVSQIKRKNEQMQHPHYKVFDCLTFDEFYGKCASSPYAIRHAKLRQIRGIENNAFVSVLSAVKATRSTFAAMKQKVAQNGWEGLILRSDTPYRNGRTSDLLKVKVFTSREYFIEDMTATTKLMQQLDGIMRPVECMGAVAIRHKGNIVFVGSGFSDIERVAMWENKYKYIGRVITVKFFEETTDKDGNPSLRFPIFVGFRDNDQNF